MLDPDSLKIAALKLFDFLSTAYSSERGLHGRPTWGHAYAAWFAALCQPHTPEATDFAKTMLEALMHQDTNHPEFSWEFVNQALIQIDKNWPDLTAKVTLDRHRAKGTRVTNWRLLKGLNSLLLDPKSISASLKIKTIIRIFQNQNGEIKDQLKTRSLQYHHFSALLLHEAANVTASLFLEKAAARATDFSQSMILPNGIACYSGRGQEQIFGYGALLALLAERRLADSLELSAVGARVISFQRPNGSFPLVLRSRAPEPNCADWYSRPPGWYSYNTLADYLPFLGVGLMRAYNAMTARV